MDKKQILAAYHWRHACKEFDDTRKISPDDFKFLLEIISLSPSSFGLQPYEIFVIENQQLKADLLPHMWGAQKQLPTASHTILFATKKDITVQDKYFEHILVEVQQTPKEMREFRSNVINNHQITNVKMDDNPRFLSDWAAKQAYIALGNVMSAAAEIGIDSCAIEGFQLEQVSDVLAKHQVIDFNHYDLALFCSFGYRKVPPARDKTRKALAELVHYV